MNNTLTQVIAILVFVCSLATATTSRAQTIWPGDFSNNGQVTGVDYLFWGYSHQALGMQRPNATTNWVEQPMGLPWSQQFPPSHNYAYADANGDGQINASDADVVAANFARRHGVLVSEPFQMTPSPLSPMIRLEFEETAIRPNQSLIAVLSLGTAQAPLTNLYGVTFTVKYPVNMLDDEGVAISLLTNSFMQPQNTGLRAFVHNDSEEGILEVTLVRINQVGVSGFGNVAKLAFQISDLTQVEAEGEFEFGIQGIRAINANFEALALNGNAQSLTLNTGGCPNTISPVCGSNGVTYLNSCYAEAAGITAYTPGTCYSASCIDPEQINPNAICPTIYQPVCGCNGITYPNACAAEAAGVLSYTAGPCAQSTCYDPQLVITSSATTVNPTTGAVTINCPSANVPVCGCNGVTYPNACVAEASGITVYTVGTCESACIDPADMVLDPSCTTEYVPVCGCNGVTYTNACLAEAAGLASYTNGPCGGNSAWCAEATPIQCGDFLTNETTAGAGNNITAYPGCIGGTFMAPDRVYVIHKQSAGDLQIGLEILTPNLDLDLFLLANNCSQITCLAKSTTNNTVTNNEGIVLEDAPVGTYYIVVDGQYASSYGDFRLEVSCGYLDCSNAVALQCGQTYQGTNLGGNDDVSLYRCGNTLNVENNGPEVVHSFTLVEAGPVSIQLSNMSANLELFLLNSCDRGACMEYSQNSGNANEVIQAYLQPGTYYVVVDGFNGAVSNYNLTVNCTSTCSLNLVNLSATSSGCGANTGSITISTSGGTPNYLIQYFGPLSGSFSTSSNTCTIYNLPPGVYTIIKTDVMGCSVSGTVTIQGGGNLSATLTPHDAVCMTPGRISVNISNGQAPYTIYLSGAASAVLSSNTSSFNIGNLEAGQYTVQIRDNNGCTISQQVTVNQSSGNFIWNYTVTPASCGGYGAIHVSTYNGVPRYNVVVSGPVSGSGVSYSNNFNITNLPGGTYQVTIEDANWCSYTRTVVVPTGDLSVDVVPQNGACGTNGRAVVNISNGSPGYTIFWSGPVSGQANTNQSTYTVNNLPPGNYTFSVQDAAGCTSHETITISTAGGGGLNVNVIPLNGTCNQNGAIWIDIYNGSPTYTIVWTGPESGTITTNDDGLDIPDLIPGTYTVIITDAYGCSVTVTVTLGNGSNLDVDLVPSHGACGGLGSITVAINGGTPAFTVAWSGPVSGQQSVNSSSLNINNLPVGTYTVSVTDANGCTDYAVTQVNSTTGNLNLVATSVHATCAAPGSINGILTGGTAPYQIVWSGPVAGVMNTNSAQFTIGNLPAGIYTLQVTDGNGCTVTRTVTINTINSNLSLSLTANGGVCSNLGNIGVFVGNGQGPYLISWSGPINGSASSASNVYQINNAPSGTYTVVVTDANGCTISRTVQLTNQNTLQATLTPQNGVCSANGSITVNISQGAPAYQISWSGPVSGNQTVNANAYTIANLPAGNYTVIITDANGCTRTLTTSIQVSNGNIQIIASLIYNICGQYNTIWVDIVGGTPPYTVTWTGPQPGSATTSTDSYEIMDLPPGTYKVTIVDANGCMTMQPDIIIYPSPVDLFTLTPNNGVCGEDGNIFLDIDGGTGPYNITWNGPVSGSQTVQSQGIFVYNNLPSGTYTFTVTDANGCSENQTVTLTNGGTPVQIIASLIYNICGQYNTIWVDIVGGTPPYTITWTGTQPGGTTTMGNGYEIMDLPPGTYKVTVVDANGCMTMQPNIIIYNTPINLMNVTPHNGVCGDLGSIDVQIIGGTGPYTLQYSGPVSGSQGVNGGTVTLNNLPSGTYQIVLTDANGCSELETVTITNIGTPVDVQVALIYNDCGQYNTLWVDIIGGTPPYTITWTGGQNGNTTTNTGAFEIMDLPPGTYKVTVVDINGCMDMQQDIIVYPAPINLFTATPINGVCSGAGGILVNIVAGTAPFTVSWTGAQTGSASFSGSSYTIPNLVAGTYQVTLIDANGCTEVETVIVSSGESTVSLTTNATEANCNEGGSITGQISGGQGQYTLSWTGPESGAIAVNGSTFTLPDLTPGTYVLTAEDALGCDDQESVTINIPEDNLSLTLTPRAVDCTSLGQISVNVLGGTAPFTVTWGGTSAGSVTINGQFVIIPNLQAGIYNVSVVGADGCSDSAQTTVLSNTAALQINATPVPGICGGTGQIGLSITGGTTPYAVSWTGPNSGSANFQNNTGTINNLAAGSYTISVSSGNCSRSIVVNLPQPTAAITLTTGATNAVCGTNGSINMSVSGGSGFTTFSWTGPSAGTQTVNGSAFTLNGLAPGTYTVTANRGGCTATRTVVVGNNNQGISILATPQPGTCGANGAIVVQISGVGSPYTLQWSGPNTGSASVSGTTYTINNLPSGSYSIQVSGSGGCSGSTTANLNNVTNNLYLNAQVIPGTCLSTPSLNVSASGGNPPYYLSYNGPVNGQVTLQGNSYSFTNVLPGSYILTLSDANGCTNIQSVNVTAGSLGLQLIPQQATCGDNSTITLLMTNGVPPYSISWLGYVDGQAVTNSSTYTTHPLPTGTYNFTVVDANGCTTTGSASVQSTNIPLDAVYSVSNNGCGQFNNIWMDFYNGTLPYTFQWIGPISGSITTYDGYYDLVEAPSGWYTLILTDANGCVNVQQVEVVNILDDFSASFLPINGSCGSAGSLSIGMDGGTAPYTIAWYRNGQAQGEVDVNTLNHNINNLAAGNYFVRITDAVGCEETANFVITSSSMVMQLQWNTVPPGCNNYGSIGLTYQGGVGPYQVAWTGPVSGSTSTNAASYLIGNLTGGTYSVTVTDANGCTGQASIVMPGTTFGDVSAYFTYTSDGLNAQFTNLSSNGYYTWNFGNGNVSYEDEPGFSFATAGSYNVCLTATGSCGSDVYCTTVSVNNQGTLALLDIGEGSGASGSTISVPVTLHNVDNLISLAGSVRALNTNVAHIVSVTPGLIAPQFNAVNGTFSYFENVGGGLNFNSDDALFYFNVVLSGSNGASSVLEFTQTPLAIEVGALVSGTPSVIPYTLSHGSATVATLGSLAGAVRTFTGEGIADAAIHIEAPGYTSDMLTDEAGNYQMPNLQPGMQYSVTATKDGNPANGLSTYALFIGQRFLLGMNPPQITSPYQVIAGDANCNDAFTTLDLFLIQRLIIGAAEDFDQCDSWVFVSDDNDMPADFDAYNVFPYNHSSNMMLMEDETANFVGVKVGDILGHANPDQFTQEQGDDRFNGQLPFNAQNVPLQAGEEGVLYFSSDAFADIVSYQFGVQFDPTQVQFLSFEPAQNAPLNTVVIGDTEAAAGQLRFSWFSLDGNGHDADAETTLFALRFRALAPVQDWASVLRIDPQGMRAEAYNASEEALVPLLSFGTVTGVNDPVGTQGYVLLQNQPNPWSDATQLSYYLPEAGESRLEVRDALGRVVWQQTRYDQAGQHQVQLNDKQLAAGVYFYTLRVNGQLLTKAMIKA